MTKSIGQDATVRLMPRAVEQMRTAIAEVGGREVFFAGTINSEGLVVKARILARGHESAVPAITETLKKGDVVIHNHPSGDIAPSEADVQLASVYSFNGHGVFIVDNEVARIYVVVEPFLPTKHKPIKKDELDAALMPNGPLARLLPQYEFRPQQAEMTQAVARAFNNDGLAVIEAPTGVGKTMAYLLPAILWAKQNGERIVVSTKTINLQEQIIYKDVPVLERALDQKFSAVLVKGRSNYLCWRKLNRALSEATLLEDPDDEASLKNIADWAQKTEDGSLSDLPFVPKREQWSKLCCEADTCRLTNCPNPSRCFVGKARREIAKADIVVVNHHILFADLSIKKEMGSFTSLAVLPAYLRVIIDEAHNIEDSATAYFGVEVTRLGALALIGRFLRHERGKERGLLPYIKAKLIKYPTPQAREEIDRALNLIDDQLLLALASAREALNVAFDAVRSLTADKCGQIGGEIKWRLTEAVLADGELRDIHAALVIPATEEVFTCVRLCAQLHSLLRALPVPPGMEESPFVTELFELEGYRERLQRLGQALAEGTSRELQENTVRWIEIDARNSGICRIIRAPLEVGPALAEWVYENVKTGILTSATLTVGRKFDHLFKRIGLDRVNGDRIEKLALETPFNFESQAMLAIPTDVPLPDDKNFLDECAEFTREALAITQGHAFVLFTSFYALDHVYKRLVAPLKAMGIVSLRQGDATRTSLLDRFRADASSVLFATDSFWEGVDVAGEALQCVILPRLPFRVPTEPILEARAEAIEAAGGNSFIEYTVPQAVIKFRQGFGRLIRRRTDRGVVLVLDRRIITKYYGRIFLDSLPEMKVLKGPRPGILLALREFFGTQK